MRTIIKFVLFLSMMAVLALLVMSIYPATRVGPEERSERLKRRVKEVCQALNLSSGVTEFHLNQIYVDDIRQILYCSVPKVSSSSWRRVWFRLTSSPNDNRTSVLTNRVSIDKESHKYKLIQPRFEDVWQDMLATYKKFLFVRHPFQRLVSAYRDKLGDLTAEEGDKVSQLLRKRILQKFGSFLADEDNRVSFVDFVRLISEQKDDEIIPWDGHWRSVHQLCNPCHIEYDFIGKFEHLTVDSDYVLRWLGVEDKVEEGLPSALRPTAASDFAHFYHSQLSSSFRLSLLAKYMVDYLSFDYDFV